MKTGGTQVKPPQKSNKSLYEEGDILVCTHSASPAYKEGNTYEVYKNEHGWKCLKGEDGLEDIISMMVSTFKKGKYK